MEHVECVCADCKPQLFTAGDVARELAFLVDEKKGDEHIVTSPLFECNLDTGRGTVWFRDRHGQRWLVSVTPLPR